MVKFLFQRNLWILDFITSIFFVVCLGYIVNTDSDLGNPNSKTHWEKILYEVSAYVITFVLAVILQKNIAWMRSWVWLGIIGALVRILMLEIIDFSFVSYSHKFLEVTINWIFYAVIGLICIFGVRCLSYIVLAIYNLYYKHNVGFPRK